MFKKIIDSIVRHRFILIGAAILALLIISPAMLFPLMSGDSYRGINIGNFSDDDFGYMAKGRDFLDGRSLGNFVLREGKDKPDPHRIYAEYIILAPIKFLGLADRIDIATLYNIYNFLGIFFLILLIYFFVLQISDDKLLALITALFTIGGYTFVQSYPTRISPFTSDFNIYGRPIMPVFGSIGFFIFLNLLTKSLKSLKWKHLFFAGISFGSLFYIYFYSWSFALALLGSLFAVYLLSRKKVHAKTIFFITLIGLIVGGYILQDAFFYSLSDVGQIYASVENTHRPLPFSKLLFLVSLLFIFFAYKHKENKNLFLLSSLILACWVALNQQVVTGKMVQSLAHYWPYFVIPACIIVGLYIVWLFIPNEKHRKFLLVFLLIMVYSNTAIRQYRGSLATKEVKQYAQNYRPIIDVLNSDPAPGVVLASDWFWGKLFIVYTHHDLFWSNQAFIFGVPIQRIVDALEVYAYLNKEARKNLTAYLMNPRGWDFISENYNFLERYWLRLGIVEYEQKITANDPAVIQKRQEFISSLSSDFKKFVDKPDSIKGLLKKYGVNYIVWDKNKNPDWDLASLTGLKELVNHNGIHLYQLFD